MVEKAPGGEPASGSGGKDNSSSVECPTCGKDDFSSTRYMKVHHKRVHGVSIAGVQTECHTCGSVFRTTQYQLDEYDNVYCSQDCQNEQLKELEGDNHPLYERVEYDCDNCGKTMERKPSRVESHKRLFCSEDCRNSHDELYEELPQLQRKKVEKTCEICGSGFEVIPFREETAKYCSRECRIEATRRITGEERYNYKPNSGKGFGDGWEQLAEEIRDRDGHLCQRCGIAEGKLSRRLDVHHLRPRSEFESIEEANQRDNLIALCRSCHKKWEGIPLKPSLLN